MTYTIEASFSYQLTVPGEVPYSSQQFRSALGLKQEAEAPSDSVAQEIGEIVLAQLAQSVKLHAINEAGLGSFTDENGVIFPAFGESSEVSNVRAIQSAPSFDPNDLPPGPDAAPSAPVVQGSPMWDGRPIRIYDNRLTRKNPKAPDLRIQFLDFEGEESDDNPKFKAFWLQNKGDGSDNKAAYTVLRMLESQA